MTYLAVTPETAGRRLDAFLAEQLPDVSRTRAHKLIGAGAVHVDGQSALPARRLVAGEVVAVELPPTPPIPTGVVPRADLPLQILYFDDWLIVVDKPAGQVVHPARGHADDTLVNALAAHFPDLVPAFAPSVDVGGASTSAVGLEDLEAVPETDLPVTVPAAISVGGRLQLAERAGIVHRLDRDTSGVMVVARNVAAAARLGEQFAARTVEKVYVALVKGVLGAAEGVVDAPVGRDEVRRKQMAVTLGGRSAQTAYRVLQAVPEAGLSWLEVRPRTGRTHQIRVHLAAIGHPVAGDVIYGRPDPRIGRLGLHALTIDLDHPQTGKRMRFSAPLPEDFLQNLSALGIRADYLVAL